MVRYPREGHGLAEPAHNVDLMDRSAAWYEKHSPAPRRADGAGDEPEAGAGLRRASRHRAAGRPGTGARPRGRDRGRAHPRKLVGTREGPRDLPGGRGHLREPRRARLQAGGRQGHVRASPAVAGPGEAGRAVSPGSARPRPGTSTRPPGPIGPAAPLSQAWVPSDVHEEATRLSTAEAERMLSPLLTRSAGRATTGR